MIRPVAVVISASAIPALKPGGDVTFESGKYLKTVDDPVTVPQDAQQGRDGDDRVQSGRRRSSFATSSWPTWAMRRGFRGTAIGKGQPGSKH